MCSKSSWLRTVSVPPRLPPVSDSVAGVWMPAATLMPELLGLEMLLLEPHAASPSTATPASNAGASLLIDAIIAASCRCIPTGVAWVWSPRGARVEGVLQAVAEQVEGEHGAQQRETGEDHVP